MSSEIYIKQLNSDRLLREALTEEEQKLNESLLHLDDVDRCKQLINSYLTSIVKEDRGIVKQSLRKRAVARENLSKRKMKRINFTKFQRLYSKNRKKAFDSLFNNSFDVTLDSNAVFSY